MPPRAANVKASGELGDVLGGMLSARLLADDKSDGASIEGGLSIDVKAAVDFLRNLDPSGWHNLVAHDGKADKIVGGHTFSPNSWSEIAEWIGACATKYNIFFSVNEPKPHSPNKKLEKTDIGAVRALHADVDPKDGLDVELERARIDKVFEAQRASALPPTFEIDSGGGRQMLAVFAEKLPIGPHLPWAEQRNLGLVRSLGGDERTANIDRVLRLPGTVNRLNKKKREAGREPAPARLVRESDRRFTIAEVSDAVAPAQRVDRTVDEAAVREAMEAVRSCAFEDVGSISDLSDDLQSRLNAAVAQRPMLDALWVEGVKADPNDRSRALIALAAQLHRAGGFAVEDFALLSAAWRFTASMRDEDKFVREVGRAWVKTEQPRELTQDEILQKYFTQPEESLFPEPHREAAPAAADPIAWRDPETWAGQPIPKREWIVDGFIPRGEVTLLYGDGGVGKTLLAHQLAVAMAAGHSWLGQPTRPGRVMAFLCEDSEDELHRRHGEILRSSGLEYTDTAGRLRLSCRRFLENLLALWDRNTGAMRRQAVWTQLRDDVKAFGADLLILDTLADIFAGEEMNRAQVTGFVKGCLGRLTQETGTTLLVLGHPSMAGKASGQGTSGSTAWSNAVRSRLYLRFPKGTDKGNIRELEGMKSNYSAKGALLKLRWRSGAFEVIAGSVPSEAHTATAIVPNLDDAVERAVVTAISLNPEMALSTARNSSNYAPRSLKRLCPELLVSWSEDEIDAAILRLEQRGGLKRATVGKTPSSHPIIGFVIDTDKLSAAPDDAGGAFG